MTSSDWVRPLGGMEHLMALGGYYEDLNTVQAIWVSSRIPITLQHMQEALRIIVERIPILKLGIRRRFIKFWYRKLVSFDIDVEATSEDPMQVYHQVLHQNYDMCNGPLWRVRLVNLPENHTVVKEDDRPYSYVLIFGVQHAITDGTTNAIICRETVEILNALLVGQKVPHVFHPMIPPLSDNMETWSSFLFSLKKLLKKVNSSIINTSNFVTSFRGAFPLPITEIKETRCLNTELPEELTRKLIGLCKKEKVTVHSCIVAVANLALFKVAQRRSSFTLESSNIIVNNCVNIRKYYPAEHANAVGVHYSLVEISNTVTKEDFQNCWHHARVVHESFRRCLKNKDHIKITPFFFTGMVAFPLNSYRMNHKKTSITNSHYITSNMGDLESLLPESNLTDPVNITHMIKASSSVYGSTQCLINFHTFRGRFIMSLDYYSTKMMADVAKEFFITLESFLKSIAVTGHACCDTEPNVKECNDAV